MGKLEVAAEARKRHSGTVKKALIPEESASDTGIHYGKSRGKLGDDDGSRAVMPQLQLVLIHEFSPIITLSWNIWISFSQ